MPAFSCFSEFRGRLHISGNMDWCEFESSKRGWAEACNDPFWEDGRGGEVPLQEHWAASLRRTRLWWPWPCEQRWTPPEDLLFRPKVKMSPLCCCCSIAKLCLDSLQPCGLQHTSLLCYSPSPRVWSNSCPLSWWCYPITLSSTKLLFSYPQSFPASGSFPTISSWHQVAKVLGPQHQSFQWIFWVHFL